MLLLAGLRCEAAGWRTDTVVLADLNNPSSVAVDAAGNVYVVDTGHNAVHTYAGSPTTGYVKQKDVAVDLRYPLGVAVDHAGNVYVIDSTGQTVRSYSGSPTAGYVRQKDVATGLTYLAVTIDAVGNVYVADTQNIGTYSGTPTSGYTRQKDVVTGLGMEGGIAVDGAGNVYVADTKNNAVHSYSGSPTAGYTKQKDVVSSLGHPEGVAVDAAGIVYVTDTSNGAVRTYSGSPTAGYVQQKDVATGMHNPHAVAVDRTGNVYAIEPAYNAVHTYSGSPSAGYTRQRDVAITLRFPVGIAVDGAGHVYVADSGNDAVRVYSGSPATGYIKRQDIAGLNYPAGVAVSAAGDLFVANQIGGQVHIYSGSPATGYTNKRNLTTDVFQGPYALALDGAGNVYVADVDNPAVYVYSGSPASGYTRQKQIGSGLIGPTGIAVDKEGNVYVTDFGGTAHAVHTYSGSPSTGYTQQQDVAADFKGPIGVTVDDAGHVYVIDYLDATLRRYSGSPKTGFTRLPDVKTWTYPDAALGLSVDGAGNLYATDVATGHNVNSVSKFTAIADTNLVTSTASAVHGAAQLTATVTAGNASTPTGSVSFCDGGAAADASFCATGKLLACSPAVLAGTIASCGSADLPVGTHTITAHYSGDADNAGSTSAALTQTVTQAATTTRIVVPPNIVRGAAAMLSATVSVTTPGTGTPTGSVTIADTTDGLSCSYMLAATSPGCTITPSSVGVKTLVATYSGDPDFTASSGNGTLTVVFSESGTTLDGAPNPSVYGQSVTLSAAAHIFNEGPSPTGTLTFFDGAAALATVAIDGNGRADYTTSLLSAGTHPLTARYNGDGFYATSTSTVFVQTVTQAVTATIAISPRTVAVGSSAAITATLSVTAPGAGMPTGTITVHDTTDNMSCSYPLGIVQPGCTLQLATTGAKALTVTYSGDANFLGSSGSTVLTVLPGDSSIALDIAPSPSMVGQAVTLVAKVGGSAGSTPGQMPASVANAVPMGTVSFTDKGAVLATIAVDANGEARYVTSSLAVGSHTVTATYSGDGSHTSAATTQMHQVNAVPIATVQAPALTTLMSGLLIILLAGGGLGFASRRQD